MKKHSTFIVSAVLTALVGIWGGFSLATSFLAINTKDIEESNLANANTAVATITQNTTQEEPKPEEKKPVSPFSGKTCPKPNKDYADESYLDVGQDVPLDDVTYIPSDLVLLTKDMSTTSICVKEEAALALKDMFAAAKKDGYTIKVSSGYRSYALQKAILAQNIKDGNKNASIAVAKPGHSEHQLGMAVDLTAPSISNASAVKAFGDTKEAEWLEDNAYLYGFIESYPEDKLDVTGYMHEAWHYRYLGIDAALEIHNSGETINQYLKEKKEEAKKHAK